MGRVSHNFSNHTSSSSAKKPFKLFLQVPRRIIKLWNQCHSWGAGSGHLNQIQVLLEVLGFSSIATIHFGLKTCEWNRRQVIIPTCIPSVHWGNKHQETIIEILSEGYVEGTQWLVPSNSEICKAHLISSLIRDKKLSLGVNLSSRLLTLPSGPSFILQK